MEWNAAIVSWSAALALSIGTVVSRKSAWGLLVYGEMLLRRKPIQSHPDQLWMLNLYRGALPASNRISRNTQSLG